MKKLIAFLFVLTSFMASSQAPQFINYQGVARTSSGVALPNQPITLTITISNTASNYSEQHSVTSNTVGIFTVLIGNGTSPSSSFAAFDWSATPTSINVVINAGFGNQSLGSQQLVSVPYALYAQKVLGSSSLPTGTVTGQTLYWDNSGSGSWKVDKNLTNDGQHVGVGLLPVGLNNKLHVVTGVPSDSAAIFGYHFNSGKNQAGVRGVSIGSAPSSTFEPISGGNFLGFNGGAGGAAVGASGQAFTSNGDALGLVGIGTSSSSSTGGGRSVGLYASAQGGFYPNAYAAVFDRGKVLVNDTLLFPTSGVPGDVLVKQLNGKAVWQNPAGVGPWTRTATTVYLANPSDNIEIGGPSGSAKVQISTPGTFGTSDLSITSAGGGYGLQIIKFAPTNLTAGVALLSNINTGSTGTVLTVANTGQGPGIYIDNGQNYGIFARSTGTVPTIWGMNWNGTGTSVRGSKPSMPGIAGQFDITYTNSPSDAVLASNLGKGAAIRATLGPTVTGSSNVGLLLEDGHLKSVQPIPATVNVGSIGAGYSVGTVGASIVPLTDVRGEVTVNGVSFSGTVGSSFKINVTFNKLYPVIPTVNITPTIFLDPTKITYYVTATNGGFSITLVSTAGSMASTPISFNYMVIE